MPISDYLRRLRERVGPELLLTPAVTGLVLDAAGRVLLQHHGDTRRWVVPGGAIDPGETPTDAVVREIFEETGLEVEPTALCGVLGGREFRVRYRNGDQVEYTMAVFVCRVRGGRLRLDGEESLDLRWIARDELATLDVAPWARLLLERVFEAPGEALLQPVRWRPPRS